MITRVSPKQSSFSPTITPAQRIGSATRPNTTARPIPPVTTAVIHSISRPRKLVDFAPIPSRTTPSIRKSSPSAIATNRCGDQPVVEE